MILPAGSPEIDSSPPALTNVSSRAPDRKKGPCNKASVPSGEFCRRYGGLLVPSYTASLECDVTGRPMRLGRCVNCGDCVDGYILANRWKGPVSARPRARPRRGPQRAGWTCGVGTGTTRGVVLECDNQGGRGS